MAIKHVNPVEIMFVDRMLKGETGEKGDTGDPGDASDAVEQHESMYDHGDLHEHINKGSLDLIAISGGEVFIDGQNYRDILTNGSTSMLPAVNVASAGSVIADGNRFCSVAISNATAVQIYYTVILDFISDPNLGGMTGKLYAGNQVLATGYPMGVSDDGGITGFNFAMQGTLIMQNYAGETVSFIFDWPATSVDITLSDSAFISLTRVLSY